MGFYIIKIPLFGWNENLKKTITFLGNAPLKSFSAIAANLVANFLTGIFFILSGLTANFCYYGSPIISTLGGNRVDVLKALITRKTWILTYY